MAKNLQKQITVRKKPLQYFGNDPRIYQTTVKEFKRTSQEILQNLYL